MHTRRSMRHQELDRNVSASPLELPSHFAGPPNIVPTCTHQKDAKLTWVYKYKQNTKEKCRIWAYSMCNHISEHCLSDALRNFKNSTTLKVRHIKPIIFNEKILHTDNYTYAISCVKLTENFINSKCTHLT